MKQKNKVSSYFATLRASQIKLLEQTISWRQKNIKMMSKKNKQTNAMTMVWFYSLYFAEDYQFFDKMSWYL